MADGSRKRPLKRRSGAVRLAGRVTVLLVCLVVITLVAIQFARVIGENIAMAHQLSQVQDDVSALRRQEIRQQLLVRRLSDPRGAIPAIHERLRLVAPNETLIYTKSAKQIHP